MSHALIAAVVAITAASVCAAAMVPLRRAAIGLGLLDMPGERRVHTTPVPRLGGLAIFLGFLVALCVSFALPVTRFEQEIARIVLLIAAAAILVGVMFFDDIFGIPPLPKLGIQVGIALLVIAPRLRGADHGIAIDHFNAPFVGGVTLPLAIAAPFTVLWIVGMMNSVNWADGIDGLAGSIGLVACVVLFLHTYFRPKGDPQFTISLLAIALAGAIVGFLPFNWHPARIIMGDTGAMFLGFALATISIIGGAKIATALLALGVPILDMAWVIVYRIAHGRSPLLADRGHLHHRLLDAGLTQRQVVACFTALTGVFGALALALPSREDKLVAIGAMGIVLLAIIALLALFRPANRSRAG
ncbi:MAG: undecaprenyl/decaprenyl-phosphate alpha-N-acetylglucosaminyl 1-phosphate transferase [Chloroflexi bacterium]|nr:MAG: undecaprenyl/decaprenyl-phosphate alpha-N-acetylglucosaminyl 1-phosphate transferase [Chloroflexota bacterium]